jgi:hypothetical protein
MKEYKLNILKSPPDYRDWKVSAIFPKVALPETLDYRSDMLPVRDQGSRGSCAAFASAAMKEWQESKDIGLKEYLSPEFIYANRENPKEEGMYTRDLLEILKEKGVCLESMFPYGTSGMPSVEALMNASKHKISNYAAVHSIDEAKTALFLNGPCLIAFPVYNYTERFWYQYPGQSFLGGHLVLKDGYTKDGFIIRNSWDDDWGKGGYCIMPFEDFGRQWEIWSSIDAKSIDPTPSPVPEPKKKGCFGQFFNF